MTSSLDPDQFAHDPSRTLLLTSPLNHEESATCYSLLSEVQPTDANVLVISYTGHPGRWLEGWRRHVGEPPAKLGYIAVRSHTLVASDAGSESTAEEMVDATTIDPSDLTGLGIAVSEYLDEWAGNDDPTVLCFDSVTVLLQYVDERTAYQFLRVLLGNLGAAGSASHFHLDPDAHDSTTVKTLRPLFDTVIER